MKPVRWSLLPGVAFALAPVLLASGCAGREHWEARVNSQMDAVLDQLADLNPKPLDECTVAEAREQPTPADAVRVLATKQALSTVPEPMAKVEDRMILGADGLIGARVYWPSSEKSLPVVVYFHGGGWVIATNDTYDASARAIAKQSGAIVVSIEYRKAPEYKFPAAHEDAFAAWRWVLANAAMLDGDPKRIAVAGESAGGNLAANVAIRARDESVQAPVLQVLIYPVAGHDMSTPSYQENKDAKPLNEANMKWFVKQTFEKESEVADPRISLVERSNLSNLAPATLITAEIDPLRSEGREYARRLTAAGVAVNYQNYSGVTHEFFGMSVVLDQAKRAQAVVGEDLKHAFAAVKP